MKKVLIEISTILGVISKNLIEIKQSLNIVNYNFDITANWATGDSNFPVIDEATFKAFLEARDKEDTNDLSDVIITDFNLTGNRLRCNLSATGNILDFSGMGIIEINGVGNIVLNRLFLDNNQITEINFLMPNTLKNIYLNNNLLVNELNISNLNLLEVLGLGNNNLTTIPNLSNKPNFHSLRMSNNNLTNSSYLQSEVWANSLPIFNDSVVRELIFDNNTNSISGTNLENILVSKNFRVFV
jgi:hypothetical protein